jgi:hypothetical protein
MFSNNATDFPIIDSTLWTEDANTVTYATVDTMGSTFSREVENIPRQLPQWYTNLILYHKAIMCVIAVIIMLGNTFTITAVVKFPRLRNPTNMIITSLSVADFLVGIDALYYLYDGLYHKCQTPLEKALMSDTVYIFPLLASVYHFMAVGVDRYIAITRPLHYHQILSAGRLKALIALVWIITFLTSVSYLSWAGIHGNRNCRREEIVPTEYNMTVEFTAYFSAGLVLLIVYAKILAIARKHESQTLAVPSNLNPGSEGSQKANKQQRKALKMVTTILVAYLLSWTPNFIVALYTQFSTGYSVMHIIAGVVTMHIGFCNSFVNIFIYIWMNKDFRVAYRALVCCKSVSHVTSWVEDTEFSHSMKTTKERVTVQNFTHDKTSQGQGTSNAHC